MIAAAGFFACLVCLVAGSITTRENKVDAISMLNFVSACLAAFVMGVNLQ